MRPRTIDLYLGDAGRRARTWMEVLVKVPSGNLDVIVGRSLQSLNQVIVHRTCATREAT